MITNINPDTGIAYGYCRMTDALWDLCFYSEDSVNVSLEYAAEDIRDEIEIECADLDEYPFDLDDEIATRLEYVEIDEPVYAFDGLVNGERLAFRVSWLGGAAHAFIFYSEHVWRCLPCSPCVPGAGDLGSAGMGDYRAYGLPPGMVDDDERL